MMVLFMAGGPPVFLPQCPDRLLPRGVVGYIGRWNVFHLYLEEVCSV